MMSKHFDLIEEFLINEDFHKSMRKLYYRNKFPLSIRNIRSVAEWMENKNWEIVNTKEELTNLLFLIKIEIENLKQSNRFIEIFAIQDGEEEIRNNFEDNEDLLKECILKNLLEEKLLLKNYSMENDLNHKISSVRPYCFPYNGMENISEIISIQLVIPFEELKERGKDIYLIQSDKYTIWQKNIKTYQKNCVETQEYISTLEQIEQFKADKKIFYEELFKFLKNLELVLEKQFENLKLWKDQQMKSIYINFPYLKNTLEFHDDIYNRIFDIIIKFKQFLNEYDLCSPLENSDYEKKNDECKAKLNQIIKNHLESMLIVDDYPPDRIIKPKFGGFSINLRLLGGKALGVSQQITKVKIRLFHENLNEVNPMTILNCQERSFLPLKGTNGYAAQFVAISLDRKRESITFNLEHPAEQKYYFIFETTINCWNEVYDFAVQSLPIYIAFSSNKDIYAKATLIWRAAFCEEDKNSCITEVNSIKFLDVINQLVYKYTEMQLTSEQMEYLQKLLIDDNERLLNDSLIAFKKTLENLPNKDYSFWKFLFACLNLISDFLKDEWKNNLIIGFISKNESSKKLELCTNGTFLLRFAESYIENYKNKYYVTLSVAVKEENPDSELSTEKDKVFFVKEFLACTHLEKLKLSKILNAMDNCRTKKRLLKYLYPDYPMEQVFSSDSRENSTDGAYTCGQLKIEINLANNCNSTVQSECNPSSVLSAISDSISENTFFENPLINDPIINQFNYKNQLPTSNDVYENDGENISSDPHMFGGGLPDLTAYFFDDLILGEFNQMDTVDANENINRDYFEPGENGELIIKEEILETLRKR